MEPIGKVLAFFINKFSFPKGPKYCYEEYFPKSWSIIPYVETRHSTI